MGNTTQIIQLSAAIPASSSGERLDHALAQLFPEHSRSRLKTFIDKGQVKVNGQCLRPRDKIHGGEQVEILAEIEANSTWEAEALPLDIVYEDEQVLIINKQANLVVHPAVGNRAGTLVNALLHRYPLLIHIPRAGIVHRLDKDTTGLLMVAKTLLAHRELVAQLQARTVSRTYEAVVWGILPAGGTVNKPIGRHPKDRKRMGIVEYGFGKEAITHYRVLEKFKVHTHLTIQLETGRTHQIRVHMAHLHHPVIGDKVYGGRLRIPPEASDELQTLLREFKRQALHAKKIAFLHPVTEAPMAFEVPLPEDMQQLIRLLRT